MPSKIVELREQRAKLIETAREIAAKADAEKRSLSAEEAGNVDKAQADAKALNERIAQEERQLELERDAARDELRAGKAERGNSDPTRPKPVEVSPEQRAELRSLFHKHYMHGDSALTAEQRSRILGLSGAMLDTAEHRVFGKFLTTGFRSFTPEEYRDLSFGSDPAGGFMVPPEDYRADLIRKIDDLVFVRQMATKMMVTQAQDLGVPTLENNPADSDWTSELATGADDATMSFGKRQFAPHPLAKRILISNKLLRASVIPVEELIRDRFAYKFGISLEKAYLLGTGAGQPLGLFTASANGIDTSRDVSSNTTAVLGPDDLINAFYTLKAPYRREASWLFNRTIVNKIMLMKDGDGQYLWRGGLQAGQPDSILGRPLMESEYVPNTYSTGNYIGMIGVYRMYWIADALDMTIQRLDELYAATNQTGFIMRMETDGMPVMAEAFVRLKLS